MTACEYWQEERAGLLKELAKEQDLNSVIYAARHAILQTEQNVLATQSDDVLRQQTGVLFALLKNSISLLNVPVSSTAWTAASRRQEKRAGRGFPCICAAGAACLLACAWSAGRGDLLGWLLPLAALILGAAGLLLNRREQQACAHQPDAQLRITQTIDAERLLGAIDAQMMMIDRCANDFAYLNNTLRTPVGSAGRQNLNVVSELLEAIYAYDDELRQQAEEAVGLLLHDMGLETQDYNSENQRLFNQLPSKSMTKTLCPAILSAEDHRLLRRGTAVVCTDAA